MPQGYLIFHLNLAFSSIRSEERPKVIETCYRPLLDLAENTGIPVGIELTGWTLRQITEINPEWVIRFRSMLECGQCELIGSGWSQLIGPLVPCEVNRYNQRLGLDAYRKILGITPRLALVNEMAFSTGMVDIYDEAGYAGIVMDRDNVRLALALEDMPRSALPSRARGCSSRSLSVLWSDSILFQRFQRVVHGDIPVSEYLEYVRKRVCEDELSLPIYCNDAEIFDYRPGRFTTEALLHSEGEWKRMTRVLQQLQERLGMRWLSPGEALETCLTMSERSEYLSSIDYPIPVKKQSKYNVNRWAVTGRDDLWLNTMCHRICRGMIAGVERSPEAWKNLCELWASDLRTHITEDRWQEALERASKMLERYGVKNYIDGVGVKSVDCAVDGYTSEVSIEKDEEDIIWTIQNQKVHLKLNVRRGLAITSLAFSTHNFEPVLGTLPQGYFSSIAFGADFYSGGVLVELPGERSRMTDLERVIPHVQTSGSSVEVKANLHIMGAVMTKTISIDSESGGVTISYGFNDLRRPMGIVRAGILTLLPEAWLYPVTISCVNGGQETERFLLDRNADHGKAATTFVSSTSSFGATDGELVIRDETGRSLIIKWDPSECAAAPMLINYFLDERWLTRVFFSLCELDDTCKPDGHLLSFSLEIFPGGNSGRVEVRA